MRVLVRNLVAIVAMLAASSVTAAPEWYVGHSFVYNASGNLCTFMRFRADSFTVAQADVLYAHLGDQLAEHAEEGATFAHTTPSAALAAGESGEQAAADFLSQGVAACTVAGEPVDGVMFISAFGCDYQNQAQMCIRLYVDTGDKDLTQSGIARGPTGVDGVFVRRPVWDASAGLVYAGAVDVPYAIESNLSKLAEGLILFRD